MSASPETVADEAFPASPAAALARLSRVDPRAYARSRNHLEGAVTRLSPYLSHGLLELPAVYRRLAAEQPLRLGDKLVQELGWREFFQQVWRHRGEKIFHDLRPGCVETGYGDELPEDVRTASTGVPVIDAAVRTLYASGYLHNHARMWLASYVVHCRKRHWRVGADWLYGHLLDGDLASNHLSWQWVAGTFSQRPYLFNAENVARYAPPAWHSPGTVIDDSYPALEQRARRLPDCGPEDRRPAPIPEPPLLARPPFDWPAAPDRPGPAVLRHLWDLGPASDREVCRVLIHPSFHRRFPWSARRWRWVGECLRELGASVHDDDWAGPLSGLPPGARHIRETLNPGYAEAFREAGLETTPAPRLLAVPDRDYPSFSQFYRAARLSPELA